MQNVLDIDNRTDFRNWLNENVATETECWVQVKRGKPTQEMRLFYLDAVEEALCFGWIDSTTKMIDGKQMQRFSPRKRGSVWTELNKERVRRLEKLGLMTPAGRKVLPKMGPRSFKIDEDLVQALKNARVYTKFKKFPPLYQRIRAYNVTFYKKRDPVAYKKALARLIEQTKQGKMYGEWNDYGRLLDY